MSVTVARAVACVIGKATKLPSHLNNTFINPRRTRAARVTVLGLCLGVFVIEEKGRENGREKRTPKILVDLTTRGRSVVKNTCTLRWPRVSATILALPATRQLLSDTNSFSKRSKLRFY